MKDYEKELEVSYQEMEEKQDLFASMSEEEQAVWEELKQMLYSGFQTIFNLCGRFE